MLPCRKRVWQLSACILEVSQPCQTEIAYVKESRHSHGWGATEYPVHLLGNVDLESFCTTHGRFAICLHLKIHKIQINTNVRNEQKRREQKTKQAKENTEHRRIGFIFPLTYLYHIPLHRQWDHCPSPSLIPYNGGGLSLSLYLFNQTSRIGNVGIASI